MRQKRHRRRQTALRLEHLQSRQLMAADIDLTGGVLEISGTDASEQIVIEYQAPSNAGSNLSATVTNLETGEVTLKAFSLDGVDSLRVAAGDGDDVVTNNTALSMTADGGDGHDVLVGGSGDDRLIGGDGDDELHGRSESFSLLSKRTQRTALDSQAVHSHRSAIASTLR